MNEFTGKNAELSESQWEHVYRILGGHIYFQTLSAAIQLHLFDILKQHGPQTRLQIAEQLGVADQAARILLLGCCALELVEKSGEQYSNSVLSDRLLVRDVPGNIVAIIEWQHFINYRPMYHFAEAIRQNKNVGLNDLEGSEQTLYERLVHSPELEKIFQRAMQSISVQVNQMVATHIDLSGVHHVVDVGGGNASNIIALAKNYPRIRATVFDSPSVCEIARENIEKAGLSQRLDARAGNCFDDPFPEDADCLLFCHFLTIWSAENNRQLLSKCFESLSSGGRVIIFNMMQDDDEKGPLTAAMGSPYFLTLATGEGMLYSWKDYHSWMVSAGFGEIQTHRLPRDHGVIVARKP